MVVPRELYRSFGPTRRRIFEFIFDNIDVTREEIELAIYGRKMYPQNKVVFVHLCGIRSMLQRYTEFKLVGTAGPRTHPRGKRPRLYKIVYKTEADKARTIQPTGSENVAP